MKDWVGDHAKHWFTLVTLQESESLFAFIFGGWKNEGRTPLWICRYSTTTELSTMIKKLYQGEKQFCFINVKSVKSSTLINPIPLYYFQCSGDGASWSKEKEENLMR